MPIQPIPFLTPAQCQVVLSKLDMSDVTVDLEDVRHARMLGIFRGDHELELASDADMPEFRAGPELGGESRMTTKAVHDFAVKGDDLGFGLVYRAGFIFPRDLAKRVRVGGLRLPPEFLAAAGVPECGITATAWRTPEYYDKRFDTLCERFGISDRVRFSEHPDLPPPDAMRRTLMTIDELGKDEPDAGAMARMPFTTLGLMDCLARGVATYPVGHEFGAFREPDPIFWWVEMAGLPVTIERDQGAVGVAASSEPLVRELGQLAPPVPIAPPVPYQTVDEDPAIDHQGLMAVAAGLTLLNGQPHAAEHAPLSEVPEQIEEPWRTKVDWTEPSPGVFQCETTVRSSGLMVTTPTSIHGTAYVDAALLAYHDLELAICEITDRHGFAVGTEIGRVCKLANQFAMNKSDLARALRLLGEWMAAAKSTFGHVAAVTTGLEERTAAFFRGVAEAVAGVDLANLIELAESLDTKDPRMAAMIELGDQLDTKDPRIAAAWAKLLDRVEKP